MENLKYVSLLEEDMVEGGGLADDFDFIIIGSKAVNHDFGPTKGGSRPCWEVIFDAEGYEDPVINYYSIGKATEWSPAPDANGFTPMLNEDQALNKNSNVGQFALSLKNSGFPLILLNEKGFKAILGAKGHAKRLPVNNRPEGENAVDSRGQKPKLLVVTELPYFEGMDGVSAAATTGKAKGKAKGKGAGSVQQAASGLNDTTVDIISTLLKSNAGGIDKKDLPRLIFSYANAPENKGKAIDKNGIMQVATNDDFLSDGPWSYENGVVKPIG